MLRPGLLKLTLIAAALAHSPVVAGQVAVINPSIGSSVSVAPTTPSVSVSQAPSSATGTSVSSSNNTGTAGLSVSTLAVTNIVSDLASIEVNGFTTTQVAELVLMIEDIASSGKLNGTELKLLIQQKQRLLDLQR
jgi:hypothetical protein